MAAERAVAAPPAVGGICPPRYHEAMQLEFTAVFRPVPEGYVAFVEELPGANTQGATLAEARENLAEAVRLVLEVNRSVLAAPMPRDSSEHQPQ